MPVFGKTLFETVLEGLDPTDDDNADPSSPAIRGFNTGFVGSRGTVEASDPAPGGSAWYDDYAADPIVTPPAAPSWINRTSEGEIADDLDLKTCQTRREIRERRRLFASENHPDRVSVAYRDQATTRMKIANQLIDQALLGTTGN